MRTGSAGAGREDTGAAASADAAPISPDPEEQIDLLLRDLGTRRSGLRSREAARQLTQHGPNEITRRERRSRLRELGGQFTHPLALLLWMAAALALVDGIAPLAVAIVAVIVLNAIFAFTQEVQAERATEALREYLPPRVRVRRDDRAMEIDARELVPGDVIKIAEGDRLSADARLIEGAVEIDASPLTGESQPVLRVAQRTRPALSLIESEDLVLSVMLCTAGEAEAVVFATGMASQLGRIAALTQRVRAEISPLQAQVNKVAQLIAAVAVAAGVVFLGLGTLVAGLPLTDSLTFAIGLLVANVPEGLLPTITLALAVGVRRMARRQALLKRLTAVETLGSTDVICTDKTGTLTEGRMSVFALWADGIELRPGSPEAGLAAREPFSGLLRTATRCNNAAIRLEGAELIRQGDPSESALLAAADALGESVGQAQDDRDRRRQRLLHFDARRKRMTTIDEEPGGQLWCHTKGAPLELLERCTHVRGTAGDRAISGADRAAIEEAFERYANRGMRVLGFAERPALQDESGDRDQVERALSFLGLAALEDPPRPGAGDAVARCRKAGIRTIVVTGDHGTTAAAVAREVGIVGADPTIVIGSDVDGMSEAELDRLVSEPAELIVARSNPETKLHLVEALRAEGHTVAMTGDGVNDAPALRRADIGVAMGESGTEVAREAATMVLANDDFSSIVAAIEEGRVVYDNIRKFVTYIFAHLTPEIVPFLIFALSGGAIPLPLTALQILAIDLGTETLPALALGREPAEPGTLERPPRSREAGIVDREILTRGWLWLGLVEAALVTGGFFFVLIDGGWSLGAATDPGAPLHGQYLEATTMTFAGITACQVGTAFAARTSHASLREIGFFSNPLLLWGILFELAFAAAIIYFPPLQKVFATAGLGVRELAILATFPFIVWGTDELRRWWLRRGAEPDRGSRSGRR
jgi:calcium-translocating P-type ATPase